MWRGEYKIEDVPYKLISKLVDSIFMICYGKNQQIPSNDIIISSLVIEADIDSDLFVGVTDNFVMLISKK